jgi:hypothetical protein
MVKTAADVLRSVKIDVPVGTKPEIYSYPDTCKDCGKAIRPEVDLRAFKLNPVIEQLSRIIVCDDCAEWRHTLRDVESDADRLVSTFRGKLDQLFCKHLEEKDEVSDLTKLQATANEKIGPILTRFAALVTYKKGTGVKVLELKEELLSIFLTVRRMDGQTVRKLRPYNETKTILRRYLDRSGVHVHNHWRNTEDAPP